MRGSRVASRSADPTMTAAARVEASCGRYFPRVRNVRSVAPAPARVAIPETAVSAGPTTSPPSFCAISASRKVRDGGIRDTRSLRRFVRRPVFLESLDDPVGDVDPRAGPDHLVVLQHHVQLF